MFGVRETINLPAWAEELPDLLPHGSGIDADWVIEGHAHHITCRNSFHCINDCGMYEGWQDFSVIIKNGRYFQNGTIYKELDITIHFHGSQYLARKHMLREYLGDTIAYALTDLTWGMGVKKYLRRDEVDIIKYRIRDLIDLLRPKSNPDHKATDLEVTKAVEDLSQIYGKLSNIEG